MKKYIILLVALALAGTANAQFHIAGGTTVTMTNGGTVTLENLSLENEGNLDQGTTTLHFKENGGSSNVTVGGGGSTNYGSITVEMTSHDLLLNDDIQVNGTITFISGQFELGGKTLTLGTNGMIAGENESACFIGASGGQLLMATMLDAPFGENPGNMGAMITSSANLGLTTITRSHVPATNGSNAGIYRIYDISPANNSGLGATLRFHYLDNELNGNTENDLDLWRNDGSGWENEGFTSRDVTADWIELTGINAFSQWTAASPANALPVELLFFTAQKLDEKTAQLDWETANERNNKGFFVERSDDGNVWKELGFVAGQGTSNSRHTYQFFDESPKQGWVYYRLRQMDFAGQANYSNVATLLFTGPAGLVVGELFPNPKSQGFGSVQLPVFAKEETELQLEIYSQLGQRISRLDGRLNGGQNWVQLDVAELPSGTYQVRGQIGTDYFTKTLIVQ